MHDYSPPDATQEGDSYLDSYRGKPQRRLFASVVFQALLDAGIQSGASKAERMDAHDFLSRPERVGPFLAMIGMDPASFCERYRDGGIRHVRQFFKDRLHV